MRASSLRLDFSPQSDGWTLRGGQNVTGNTARQLTLSGADASVVGGGTGVVTTFPSVTATLVGQSTPDTLTNKSVGASTTSRAALKFVSGTAPSVPAAGDLWWDGTYLRLYDGAPRDVVRGRKSGLFYLYQCYTPTATGADALSVATIPYSPVDGVTSLTYAIRKVYFRQETAGTTASTYNVEYYTGTAAFSATGTLFSAAQSVAANAYESSAVPSVAALSSGTKVRVNVGSIGASSAAWSVWMLLEEQ